MESKVANSRLRTTQKVYLVFAFSGHFFQLCNVLLGLQHHLLSLYRRCLFPVAKKTRIGKSSGFSSSACVAEWDRIFLNGRFHVNCETFANKNGEPVAGSSWTSPAAFGKIWWFRPLRRPWLASIWGRDLSESEKEYNAYIIQSLQGSCLNASPFKKKKRGCWNNSDTAFGKHTPCLTICQNKPCLYIQWTVIWMRFVWVFSIFICTVCKRNLRNFTTKQNREIHLSCFFRRHFTRWNMMLKMSTVWGNDNPAAFCFISISFAVNAYERFRAYRCEERTRSNGWANDGWWVWKRVRRCVIYPTKPVSNIIYYTVFSSLQIMDGGPLTNSLCAIFKVYGLDRMDWDSSSESAWTIFGCGAVAGVGKRFNAR